jgi:hypothetical protein
MVTMSQKSSLLQPANSVSQVLIPDSLQRRRDQSPCRRPELKRRDIGLATLDLAVMSDAPLQNAASDIQDQAEQQDGVDCARARKWYEMAAAGGDTSACGRSRLGPS